MSELEIKVSAIEGTTPVTVLHLSGHLHGDTEHILTDEARQSLESGARYLLLDLSDVDVLTSAGLRAIQTIFNLFTPQEDKSVIRKHGEEPYKSPYFKLVCPNPHIYYVLNISGFLQSILIFNDMDEALRSFSE